VWHPFNSNIFFQPSRHDAAEAASQTIEEEVKNEIPYFIFRVLPVLRILTFAKVHFFIKSLDHFTWLISFLF
jgi:hypothetical protein